MMNMRHVMRQHRRLMLGAVACMLAAGTLLMGTAAQAQTSSVLATSVRGPITPVIASHLEDAIAAAHQGGHEALIVELDTPGGLGTAMRDIVQHFLTAPVPVVIHVAPPGAGAGSAGAVITYAAHVAAMSPGTNIGAATPVDLEGGEVIDKVVEDMVAYVSEIAVVRDRDPDFAVDMVREGRSVGATEAVEIGAVDLIAANRADLLSELDGLTVVLHTTAGAEEEVTLATADAAVLDYEMSTARRILQTLADPNLAFLFLSIGTLAILYEIANPGGGLGGILGGIMILLFLFSVAVLPVDLIGIALLLLAVGLFVAELFAPGIGVFAAGGAISLLLSGLFLFQRPTGIGVDFSVLLPMVILAGIGAALVGRLVWRTHRLPTYAGEGSSMIGDRGVVLDIDGDHTRVRIGGALWRARSAGPALERGEHVRVVDVDGLELIVEPADRAEEGVSGR
jgi:membrane-bound serine protease (ClpP class)